MKIVGGLVMRMRSVIYDCPNESGQVKLPRNINETFSLSVSRKTIKIVCCRMCLWIGETEGMDIASDGAGTNWNSFA